MRVSCPVRTKECGASPEAVPIRSQPYSSMRMRAVVIGSVLSTKCRASAMPNCSADSMPCSLAKANTVFLVVSVGSTLALEPE